MKRIEKIGAWIFLLMMAFFMIIAFDSDDMDELCSDNYSYLYRNGTEWHCTNSVNFTTIYTNVSCYSNDCTVNITNNGSCLITATTLSSVELPIIVGGCI